MMGSIPLGLETQTISFSSCFGCGILSQCQNSNLPQGVSNGGYCLASMLRSQSCTLPTENLRCRHRDATSQEERENTQGSWRTPSMALLVNVVGQGGDRTLSFSGASRYQSTSKALPVKPFRVPALTVSTVYV